MNFVAAYNFFFPPQIAIRRYTGTNSSSQARKNNKKSWERKTSACADACINKRAKYKLDFFLIFQLAAADKNVINPLKATKGADNPSTPRDHSKPIDGSQEALSTSCKVLSEVLNFWKRTPIISKKSINKKLNEIFLGSELSSPSYELKKGIINAPIKGSKIIDDSQGKDSKFIYVMNNFFILVEVVLAWDYNIKNV